LNNALALDPNSPIEIEVIDPHILAIPYSLEDALNISSENNLELKNYRLNVENYKYEKRNAKLAFLPTFYGSARYSRDNEYLERVYSNRLDEDYSVSIGVQMNLNIFKGFADKAELSRQTLNYNKPQEYLFEQKRLLKAGVTYAQNSLKAYKEIAEINEENLKSAEEDLRLAQERYKIGAGTLLEVIDAQLAVTEARRTLVSAKYDTQVALAYLKLIMGINE
jgi:outer membrane protein TolC